MRALAVEPAAQEITVIDVSHNRRTIAERFACFPPRVMARFPNGDVLLAAPTGTRESFSIGGLGPVAGSALVVGRRNEFGEHAAARTTLDELETMISWVSILPKVVPPEPVWPTVVRAIVVDPVERIIIEVEMQATVPAMEKLLRAPPLLYCRVNGGNLYGDSFERKNPSLWRKEHFTFPGRVVIVGVSEDDTHMVDATISLSNLRETIQFKVSNSSEWISYSAGTD